MIPAANLISTQVKKSRVGFIPAVITFDIVVMWVYGILIWRHNTTHKTGEGNRERLIFKR
jgi:hypothetical protein